MDAMAKAKHATREAWMLDIVAQLLPIYEKHAEGRPPKIRVSIGRTSKKSYLGECWHAEHSADNTREIFIRPDQDDPHEVAGILAHELVHAFLPKGTKHGKVFKRLGEAVGLEGKPTCMSPGKELKETLRGFVKSAGAFPHAKLNMLKPDKKQTTRLKKAMCGESGYVVRVTKQWLEMFGPPICPHCEEPMVAEGTEDNSDED